MQDIQQQQWNTNALTAHTHQQQNTANQLILLLKIISMRSQKNELRFRSMLVSV